MYTVKLIYGIEALTLERDINEFLEKNIKIGDEVMSININDLFNSYIACVLYKKNMG